MAEWNSQSHCSMREIAFQSAGNIFGIEALKGFIQTAMMLTWFQYKRVYSTVNMR